jgi:hypothetical protein
MNLFFCIKPEAAAALRSRIICLTASDETGPHLMCANSNPYRILTLVREDLGCLRSQTLDQAALIRFVPLSGHRTELAETRFRF